jgi:hypothetical protein
MRRGLANVLGEGILVAEDEPHRIQRKALNPAFGPGQLRDLTGVFIDKANEVYFSGSIHLSWANASSAQRHLVLHARIVCLRFEVT